jgi:hypothetical protein
LSGKRAAQAVSRKGKAAPMRFQINLDCTPEEARKFFGVPDMMPMQQAMMDQLNSQLMDNMKTMDSETLMKTWVPAIFQGWSEVQQNFWRQMSNMGGMSVNTDPNGKS